MRTTLIIPSLKISGGTREALRLVTDVENTARTSRVLCMWNSPYPMASNVPVELLSLWTPKAYKAAIELPALMTRFGRWLTAQPHDQASLPRYIFTHYATLPLALMVPRSQRFFFVQDLEWNFVGNGVVSSLLRRVVLAIYRSGRIISANAYLSGRLAEEGINVALEAPIWADPAFQAPDAPERNIHFAMVLRKGKHKRLDLYLSFIELARSRGLRIAAVTPEDEICAQVRDHVDEVLLRPQLEQMRDLYARSACFIHLSDHEGFGLPPLEAMGAGCIPVCRDSGGVRAFMTDGPFADLLLPLSMPLEDLLARAEATARDPGRPARHTDAREQFLLGLGRCEQARNGLTAAMLAEEQ